MDPVTLSLLYGGAQGISSWLSSREQRKAQEASKLKKVKTLSRHQKDILRGVGDFNPEDLDINNNQTYQAGSDYINNLLSGDPEAFKAFEAPHMRQFQEEIIPGIAERFSGMGAQRSSAFQQALGQAGAGLSERLAALRGNLQMNALGQGLQYARAPGEFGLSRAQLALGTPEFGYTQKGGPGGGGGFLSGLGQGAASGLGMYGLLRGLGGGSTPKYESQKWMG